MLVKSCRGSNVHTLQQRIITKNLAFVTELRLQTSDDELLTMRHKTIH